MKMREESHSDATRPRVSMPQMPIVANTAPFAGISTNQAAPSSRIPNGPYMRAIQRVSPRPATNRAKQSPRNPSVKTATLPARPPFRPQSPPGGFFACFLETDAPISESLISKTLARPRVRNHFSDPSNSDLVLLAIRILTLTKYSKNN
jgi:hypothetical protein